MASPIIFDVAIVGAGIVGTATAMTLAKLGLQVALIEAESDVAVHQTGNNSGVIHSGLYYRPDSQKAKNCALGRDLLYQFCMEHQIAHEQCGKLVIATNEEEIDRLKQLQQRGQENGLADLRWLNAKEIHEYEPHIQGIAGLHVPQTGIVDFRVVTQAYCRLFKQMGGKVFFNYRITQAAFSSKEWHLHSSAKSNKQAVVAKYLVNCAGLQCDRIAKICGLYPQVKIIPFRGEYYKFIPESHLVQGLVYPVPDPKFPFLGVHFTRMINGEIEAGPNAVLALKREGYSKCSFSLADSFDSLSYLGLWRLGSKYWKTGASEIWRSLYKPAFVKALQKLMPRLEAHMLKKGGAGVRAQALSKDGTLLDDFHFESTENSLHLLNAPSPAATSSLAIAQTISNRITKASFQ